MTKLSRINTTKT